MNKYRIQLGSIIALAIIALSLLLSLKATPDMALFFALKRAQEKIFLGTKSTPRDQVDYMSSMLESRLEELKTQVDNQSYAYILPSASRYSTLAGQITDLIVANNLTDQAEYARKQFLTHRKILDQIYFIYPKNTDNWEWKYIQDDYNYLKLYLDKLQEIK